MLLDELNTFTTSKCIRDNMLTLILGFSIDRRSSESYCGLFSFESSNPINDIHVTMFYQALAARSSNGLSSGGRGSISFFLKTTQTSHSKPF